MKKPNRAQRRKTEFLKALELVKVRERSEGIAEGIRRERARCTIQLEPNEFGFVDLGILARNMDGLSYVRVASVGRASYKIPPQGAFTPAARHYHELRAVPMHLPLPDGLIVGWYQWELSKGSEL